MSTVLSYLLWPFDRALSDSNYANIFPIWDIVFGTVGTRLPSRPPTTTVTPSTPSASTRSSSN